MNAAPAQTRDLIRLSEEESRGRQRAHLKRVRAWTTSYRERASRAEKHPVYDFLWEYYSLRPAQLERWHPGIGVGIAGEHAKEFLKIPDYVQTAEVVYADPLGLGHRLESVRWIASLLRACVERTASFACFGLHEWAMLYRSANIRHNAVPLRLQPDELASVVENLPICCTHFDAFRFFTNEARPLNRVKPDAESRIEFEQPGCIHVTMDLYKWSYKLLPFTPSELLADAFELALAAREIDMRASPYDLRDFGFSPIKIETQEGRAEYERAQRLLADRAAPIRERLRAVCRQILESR